ncbi:response regulator [Chishuiella sp.]|uniref:response regulator n=1 Tax=Chishuiella sp. TaxID=1969467 RepID=UPI0028B227FC|nr:response regulator [Chishuiella sp.]
MKALIIDDNDIARTTLMHLAKQIPNLTITNEFSNAIEAYNYLQSNHVDLIFLDIEMPEMNGIELTKNLSEKNTIIIFTSPKKEDDQIVPYENAGVKSAKLLKNGKLITYPGFPHGMPTTEAATINKDLLEFIEG